MGRMTRGNQIYPYGVLVLMVIVLGLFVYFDVLGIGQIAESTLKRFVQ